MIPAAPCAPLVRQEAAGPARPAFLAGNAIRRTVTWHTAGVTAGVHETPEGRSARWRRTAAAAVLALVLGACGDTAVGPPRAPQGVYECPEQAAVLAEQPPWAPTWPDRWETEFSGVGFVSRGSIGPASGVDPVEVQDEFLSRFLSSGFELLGFTRSGSHRAAPRERAGPGRPGLRRPARDRLPSGSLGERALWLGRGTLV